MGRATNEETEASSHHVVDWTDKAAGCAVTGLCCVIVGIEGTEISASTLESQVMSVLCSAITSKDGEQARRNYTVV